MEENEEKKQTQEIAPPESPKKSSGIFKNKFITLGIPVFIVQLVVVYFITANFLLSKVNEIAVKDPDKKEIQQKENTNQEESGKFIFSIDDIIVNPAGTDGKRLLLTSLGFDINSEEDKTLLQSKEIIIKDVVITTLSSTELDKLNSFGYRDTLKVVLKSKLRQMIPVVKINKIYFSKFILQ